MESRKLALVLFVGVLSLCLAESCEEENSDFIKEHLPGYWLENHADRDAEGFFTEQGFENETLEFLLSYNYNLTHNITIDEETIHVEEVTPDGELNVFDLITDNHTVTTYDLRSKGFADVRAEFQGNSLIVYMYKPVTGEHLYTWVRTMLPGEPDKIMDTIRYIPGQETLTMSFYRVQEFENSDFVREHLQGQWLENHAERVGEHFFTVTGKTEKQKEFLLSEDFNITLAITVDGEEINITAVSPEGDLRTNYLVADNSTVTTYVLAVAGTVDTRSEFQGNSFIVYMNEPVTGRHVYTMVNTMLPGEPDKISTALHYIPIPSTLSLSLYRI